MRRASLGSFVLLSLIAKTALACSGPGAGEAIGRAERNGWLLFLLSLVIAALSALGLRRWSRIPQPRWPLAALLLLHPGWWMSARAGDCGMMRMMGATAFTALLGIVVLILFWHGLRRTS
jgi:hypothetical protein